MTTQPSDWAVARAWREISESHGFTYRLVMQRARELDASGGGEPRARVESNRCDCHPETCCCGPYTLTLDGEFITSGHEPHVKRVASALEQALTQQRGECEALWCLHVLGPDDVHPAPSKAHAEKAAERLNAFMASRKERHPLDPECRAIAAPWPHSPESHAESVERFITEWLTPATPQPSAEGLRDEPGNDPRVDDDSYVAAVRACRSQLGARRPDDDEPEEQWMWDKLTKLESLLAGGGEHG